MLKLNIRFHYCPNPKTDKKLEQMLEIAETTPVVLCVPKCNHKPQKMVVNELLDRIKSQDLLCAVFGVPSQRVADNLSQLYEDENHIARAAWGVLGAQLLYLRCANFDWLVGTIRETQVYRDATKKEIRDRKKTQAIEMHDNDIHHKDIGVKLGVDRVTVDKWIKENERKQ